ncbi:unnamed protein product [Orchesella dallaii]|uniref:Uncharacterized protein n=1 Tax=Orchesella dallaii TaxID=48710 RepID=A0ABP1RVC5_9HEXA
MVNQIFKFLTVAACIFAAVSAFPASFEDESNYLRTAREIIQGRVGRSPQQNYYNSYQNYNPGFGYGYPSHGGAFYRNHNVGRRMDYQHFNIAHNNNGYYPSNGHYHHHG